MRVRIILAWELRPPHSSLRYSRPEVHKVEGHSPAVWVVNLLHTAAPDRQSHRAAGRSPSSAVCHNHTQPYTINDRNVCVTPQNTRERKVTYQLVAKKHRIYFFNTLLRNCAASQILEKTTDVSFNTHCLYQHE